MDPFNRQELDWFRNVIEARLGLRYDNGRMDVLADALRQRLDGKGRPERYLQALASGIQLEELRALAALLTVTETYFFRSPEHFRVLAEVAIPQRLRALNSSRRLRILSAGCSSGDEPYSAAIVLRERFADLADATIVGIDLNPAMLEQAHAARYGPWSLRQMSADLLERYFSKDGQKFALHSRIRSMVNFAERNVGVEDGVGWDFEPFDVIFCRNTIMYLGPEAARLTVARLTRALVPEGFLFLSHAETLRGLSRDFHLRHTHDTFYYQKREGSATAEAAPGIPAAHAAEGIDLSWVDAVRRASDQIENLTKGSSGGSMIRTAAKRPETRPALSPARLGSAFELLQQERYREALEAVRVLPPEFDHDGDALLLRAVLLTNCGDVPAAQEVCQQLLSSDDLNASAQYVTALCREHAGDCNGAKEHDRAAVYLDPTFAMPHLHLGLLAKRSGDLVTARHEIEQATSLLEREDASRILLLGGGFSRQALLEFSRAELRSCGGHG